MIEIHVTNLTMNANLAVYLGAFTDKIFNLAILDVTPKQTILNIVPYLKQLCIAYKIYSNENAFIQDINSFHPDAILIDSDNISFYKELEKIVNILNMDIIAINLPNNICLEQDWYSVSIFNPATRQTTYLCHTNGKQNIPNIIRLDNYQTIYVEWLPEIF